MSLDGMPPRLRGLAASQGGVFTRRQAKDCGCSERELKTRTGARGDWVVVRRGVYVERALWAGMDENTRYQMVIRAALLVAMTPAVASHSSAAVLLGIPMLPRWRRLVHVTRHGVTGSRTEGGVKHHLAAYQDSDLATAHDLQVTGLARTAVDIGREFGFDDGVVAADAALRLGASTVDLEAVLTRMVSWPYITRARAAAAAADGGAESVGETFTRLLILELGLGTPETQFVVTRPGRSARVDLRLRRHLIEFDGKVKYLGRERNGFADRPVEEIVWEEKRREDWLRNVDGGYGMSRVIWSDLWGQERERTKLRLYRDITLSDQRFGGLDAA
jgi:predicted transcriptional regulator of viral defense system